MAEQRRTFNLRALLVSVACFSAAIALATPEVLALPRSSDLETFNLLARLATKSPLILAAVCGGVGVLYGRLWRAVLLGLLLLLPIPLLRGAFFLYSVWLRSS